MPGTILMEDGVEVSIDDLELGTEVELDDGSTYVVVEEDDLPDMEAGYDEGGVEYAEEYGKSDDFVPYADDYSQLVSKAYNEAATDDERAAILSDIAKAAAEADERAAVAQDAIIKMEQDAYITECISKAEEYGIAGPRTDLLGITLAKAMTVLDDDEIQLLDDILKSYSDLAYEVAIGSETDGVSEVMDVVTSAADEIVKSAGGSVSHEQAMAIAFEQNPDLYAMYLSEKEL